MLYKRYFEAIPYYKKAKVLDNTRVEGEYTSATMQLETDIESIGKCLGADVVPCLYNSAVKAEGIGDKITEIIVPMISIYLFSNQFFEFFAQRIFIRG